MCAISYHYDLLGKNFTNLVEHLCYMNEETEAGLERLRNLSSHKVD